MPVYDGLKYTGALILLGSLVTPIIYFPMWGGMLKSPREDETEEDYYLAEYSPEEINLGMAALSLKFATESRSQRGSKKRERLRIFASSMKRISPKVGNGQRKNSRGGK